jgi:RNA polymerase sigma factor (sigma-70 family)
MTDLIERWAAGDAAAGEKLYREYFARVRDYIAAHGSDAADADDIAQDALLEGLKELRGGARPRALTGWMIGIAKHVRAHRTRLTLRSVDRPDPSQRGGGSVVVRREMGELLRATLDRLSDTDRRVLDLAHRDGLSRKEIAEELGVEVAAVHSRFDRVHERLREALGKHFTTLVARRAEGPSLADIQKLRPIFRDSVTLRHLEGVGEADAARRLGVSAATLRARLRGAYELLGYEEAPDFSRALRDRSAQQRG